MELWKRFTKLADKYWFIVFTNDNYFSVNSATKITYRGVGSFLKVGGQDQELFHWQ